MNLYKRIAKANDRAIAIEERLGHPQLRKLLLRTLGNTGSAYSPTIEDKVVVAKITSPSPRLIGLTIGSETQAVEVSANDYVAEISRSVPRDDLVRRDASRVVVFVDARVDDDGNPLYMPDGRSPLGGVEGRIIHVDDRDCCKWKVLIRRMRDK
jgi:hypothetical protein